MWAAMADKMRNDENSPSPEGDLGAESAEKKSKAEISVSVIILGGPFVYLGLILVVLYEPAVMAWLGLDSFVQYLIQIQPAGYENLVRLRNPEFADYFFHFHAATMLIFFVLCLSMFIATEIYRRKHGLNIEMKSQIQAGKVNKVFWYGVVVLVIGLYCNLNWPTLADDGGKLSVTSGGLGMFVFASVTSMIMILLSMTVLYLLIVEHYWPKVKNWLVG